MHKFDLEKLINKPRAFRNHKFSDLIPIRQTMIILGSDAFNRDIPRNYRIFKSLKQSGQLFF
jgi:hypothetical protein